MSVENKIREMMSRKLDEAAYPGANQGPKDDSAPMQGSSQKPEIHMMDNSASAPKLSASTNPLKPNAGPGDSAPHMQGSSQHATIDLKTDQSNQGTAQAAKAKKQPVPVGKGAGAAPNYSQAGDPSSVINQPSSKGNVHQEEVEGDEDEFISEEEYNALSDEEKAEYVLVETETTTDEGPEDETELDEAKMEMMKKKEEMMKKMKEELAKDVENLFASEADLSEEFKSKAASLFEAVVTARVAHEIEEMEDILVESAAAEVARIEEEMEAKVDAYLSYVAEQWLEQNAVAVESGLRAEVTENFIAGLKVLFQEHYIEVPEEKYDVLGDMQTQLEELTAKLNESMAREVELNSALVESKRDSVFTKATSDLAQTEIEKLRGLVENVEFESEEMFEEKIKVIKNSYFPKTSSTTPSLTEETANEEYTDSIVAKYAEVLSRRK